MHSTLIIQNSTFVAKKKKESGKKKNQNYHMKLRICQLQCKFHMHLRTFIYFFCQYTFVSIIHLFFPFCDARGAALLVEAAEMGNPDALYELGCRLRVEVSLLCRIFCYYFQEVTNICSFDLSPPRPNRHIWLEFYEWWGLDSGYVVKALLDYAFIGKKILKLKQILLSKKMNRKYSQIRFPLFSYPKGL